MMNNPMYNAKSKYDLASSEFARVAGMFKQDISLGTQSEIHRTGWVLVSGV